MEDLEALSSTVSGTPGRDYPIYSAAPNTSFSCDGLENGGHWAIYLKCHLICSSVGLISILSLKTPIGGIHTASLKDIDTFISINYRVTKNSH